MDNLERQEGRKLTLDKDTQINVVVNHPAGEDEDTIDFGRVFHNMKLKKRIFAWLLVLCLTVGVCAPLLLYQFSKTPLTVSSVVSLTYDAKNLSAPDGTALDLSQITGSYVLQNALSGLALSHPLTLSQLKNNIKIERVLTEDSRRLQEVAAKMVEDKNTNAYTTVQNVQMTYENRFVVSLTNGFGEEEEKNKFELTDGELRIVLDRVLTAYNDYLVETYATIRMPDDEISVIDPDKLDVLESLDLLRSAQQNLISYCQGYPTAIRGYRSWRTGRTLNDWIRTLTTGRSVSIDYLYSYVYNNNIVRDRDTALIRYEYQLQVAQNQLDTVNEKIKTNQELLKNYKNDEIHIASQEGDSSRNTAITTTTDYYNRLVMEQAANYKTVASLETRIEDLQDKIDILREGKVNVPYDESVERELKQVIASCADVLHGITDHMIELQSTSAYTTYAEHTVPQGKSVSFLTASVKKMIIGAVAGAAVACGLWFLAGLAPEFRHESDEDKARKEAHRA